jgi:hypothetical protein
MAHPPYIDMDWSRLSSVHASLSLCPSHLNILHPTSNNQPIERLLSCILDPKALQLHHQQRASRQCESAPRLVRIHLKRTTDARPGSMTCRAPVSPSERLCSGKRVSASNVFWGRGVAPPASWRPAGLQFMARLSCFRISAA